MMIKISARIADISWIEDFVFGEYDDVRCVGKVLGKI